MDALPSSLTPLCFNRNEFTKTGFSVERFLAQTRTHVSLDQIKEDLHLYLKIIQNAMIELINKDYADFVNLSSNLVNLKASLEKLRSEFVSVSSDFEEHSTVLSKATAELSQKMNQKVTFASEQMHLRNEMRLLLHLRRLEALSQRELTGELVDRLISTIQQMQPIIKKSPAPFQLKLNTILDIFDKNLSRAFLDAIEKRNRENLRRILNAYLVCDRGDMAQVLFTAENLEPEITAVVGRDVLIGSKVVALQKLFDTITNLYENYKIAFNYDASTPELHSFLLDCLFTALLNAIETKFSDIIVPSDPRLFHQCYLKLMHFVNECPAMTGLQSSKSHPILRSVVSKFSLSVYFRLRFHEKKQEFEAEFLSKTASDRIKDSDSLGLGFTLKFTSTVYQSIKSIWASDVFLEPLAHQFWELQCQILSRYNDWLKSQLENLQPLLNAKKTSQMKKSDSTNALSTVKSEQLNPAIGNNGMTTSAYHVQSNGVADLNGKETGSENLTGTLAFLLVDSERLQSHLLDLFHVEIWPLLQSNFLQGNLDAKSSLKACLQQSFDSWKITLGSIETAISTHLTNKFKESLELVADVPRQYRWTRKEAPNQPSAYIQTAFQPLVQFLESEQHAQLDSKLKQKIVQSVFSDVMEKYFADIKQVMDSVNKVSSSLIRLKKGANKTTADAATTDDDKIRSQLILDVQEFQRQMQLLPVHVDNNFRKFKDLLKQPTGDDD